MYGNRIFLAVLNDYCTKEQISAYKEWFDVVGIVTDKVEELKAMTVMDAIYDYNAIDKIGEVIIIADDLWNNDLRIEFNKILSRHGLQLGFDYVYHSMQSALIDTNIIFEMVNRNIAIFSSVIRRIIGDRKFVMVHGNCQSHVIISMLSGNKEFVEKYVTCVMPRIWEKTEKTRFELMVESRIFDAVDYLFIQQISNDNKFGYEYSTEFLSALVPANCKIVLISNLFFLGYFPQYKKIRNPSNVNFFRGKLLDATEYVDINILKMIIDDKDDEEIIEEIMRIDYYGEEEILSIIHKELEGFKLLEENIDIKMYDYLIANYKKYLMFVTSNHPAREVMEEFTKRILKSLNIEDLGIVCSEDAIQEVMEKEWRYLVYPSVLKSLGIERDMQYSFRAFFTHEEKDILKGIDEAEILQERDCGNFVYYEVNCDFEVYMRIYVRCLRASLMLL